MTNLYGKVKAHEIYVPIFNQYFYVLFGQENWNRLCVEEPELKEYIGDNSYGLVAHNLEENRLYLYFEENTENDRGTMPHELYHLAIRICEARGIKQKDEELVAHLIGYLYTQVKPLFNNKK